MDSYPIVTGPKVVELALVKYHQRLVAYLGQTSNPSLAWNKADVLEINGDDELHISVYFTDLIMKSCIDNIKYKY